MSMFSQVVRLLIGVAAMRLPISSAERRFIEGRLRSLPFKHHTVEATR
jgi:hypothetical protein